MNQSDAFSGYLFYFLGQNPITSIVFAVVNNATSGISCVQNSKFVIRNAVLHLPSTYQLIRN